MSQSFDRVDASQYTSLPRVNAHSAVALARALLVALPKGAPVSVRHAARQLRAAAVALQEASRAAADLAAKPSAGRTVRAVDNEADALLAAVQRRLADFELLGTHDPESAESAAALRAALFPRGTEFARGDALTQWEQTEGWFAALAADGREATLRSLVGGGYLDALRTVHAEYGDAIGTTRPRAPQPGRPDVAAALAAVVVAAQDLVLQLVALANDRSADPVLGAAARFALRPIDGARENNARRGSQRAAAAEPAGGDDPLPEV
jgi:hypothetical protein